MHFSDNLINLIVKILKTASLRDQSWHPSCLTISLPQSPEGMHMPTTWLCFTLLVIGKDVVRALSHDMTTISLYLTRRGGYSSAILKVTTAFHLNNRETKRELKINNNGKLLPFCPVSSYLGAKLDRSLTYRIHFEPLRKKLTTRVALLRRLAA